MKSLQLFNSVLEKDTKTKTPYICYEEGLIIEPGALHKKDQILNFYAKETLKGNQLNQTFHKSWAKIKNSSRFELFIEQITHYISTYGSDFKDEVYIPDEVLDIPDTQLKFKVIKAISKSEMTEKCLSMLQSGVALKEQTINDIISLLVEGLDYKFTGVENIKNREAIIKLADIYGIIPNDTMEFFRYIIYRATGQSLLIKNDETIETIEGTNFNPAPQFKQFGLEKLATIFNRFKPLFIAFKRQCPQTINKISKLSKKYHQPLITNPLNEVTSKKLTDNKQYLKYLDNATPFALFKALNACHNRIQKQDTFIYKVRNGKSWVTDEAKINKQVCKKNYTTLYNYIIEKFKFNDSVKIYIPKNIQYSIPTSEKMFVGNIPTGTKFIGEKLAVGVYWKNDWGANDLDISAININGKIGWNSSYNQGGGNLMYSGDITNAPDGAVEYLYANKGLKNPSIIQNNVYSGDNNCKYKIIIGKGDKIDYDYMMNPNNLFVETTCESIQKQTILGIMLPCLKQKQTILGIMLPCLKQNHQEFVLLNLGAGQVQVSGNHENTKKAIKALTQEYQNPISLNDILEDLGAKFVDTPEKADIDLSVNSLEKDTIMNLFTKK